MIYIVNVYFLTFLAYRFDTSRQSPLVHTTLLWMIFAYLKLLHKKTYYTLKPVSHHVKIFSDQSFGLHFTKRSFICHFSVYDQVDIVRLPDRCTSVDYDGRCAVF